MHKFQLIYIFGGASICFRWCYSMWLWYWRSRIEYFDATMEWVLPLCFFVFGWFVFWTCHCLEFLSFVVILTPLSFERIWACLIKKINKNQLEYMQLSISWKQDLRHALSNNACVIWIRRAKSHFYQHLSNSQLA